MLFLFIGNRLIIFIYREQTNPNCNKAYLENLKKCLNENDELQKIFDDALMVDEAVSLLDSDFSYEEIKIRYEDLFNLKHNGRFIMELLSKDHVLIENEVCIPDCVHDVTYDYKKEKKLKDKYKSKRDKAHRIVKKRKGGSKKKNSDDSNDENDDDHDSEASSKKVGKTKYKHNKTDSDDEKYNSDCDTDSSKHSTKKEYKPTNTIPNDDPVYFGIPQRARTPPPPYSHGTPSASSVNFKPQNDGGYEGRQYYNKSIFKNHIVT